MKCIVVKLNTEQIKHDLRNCSSEAINWSRGGCPQEHQVRMRWDSDLSENMWVGEGVPCEYFFDRDNLRGSSENFGIFFIIGPILLKFSHNM